MAGVLLWGAVRAAPADVPAVIVTPDAASRAELARVVQGALQRVSIPLADDALTDSDVLSIERTRVREAGGRLANGRELRHPDTFHLVLRGRRCVLVQAASGERWALRHTRCVPRAAPAH